MKTGKTTQAIYSAIEQARANPNKRILIEREANMNRSSIVEKVADILGVHQLRFFTLRFGSDVAWIRYQPK